jgi:predicted NBD/HSP70 family sugar kinase
LSNEPLRKASPNLVRDLNRSAILRLIGREGPIARAEIARRLALSPATVTAVTRRLIGAGLVNVVDQAPSRGGRPALLLGVVGGAAHALGVKVAADHLVGVRVDLDAQVVERFEYPFEAAHPDALERLAEILRSQTAPREGRPVVLGIGLGVPGVVDGGEHSVVHSPMLGWHSLAVGTFLEERLGVPVLVENDVNTLAVAGRLYGRGRDVDHFLTVTIGRGVGLGIIVDGDVYRGAHGGAGEFGHVAVVEDGPVCECGKHGCLEALVADPALVGRAVADGVLRDGEGIERLRELAEASDLRAARIFSDAGGILGRAVAGLVNVLSPQLVLISGEGTQAWAHMSRAFHHSLGEAVFPPLRDVAVEIDPWDDGKWARGAAALVLRAMFVTGLDEQSSDYSVRARLERMAAL